MRYIFCSLLAAGLLLALSEWVYWYRRRRAAEREAASWAVMSKQLGVEIKSHKDLVKFLTSKRPTD